MTVKGNKMRYKHEDNDRRIVHTVVEFFLQLLVQRCRERGGVNEGRLCGTHPSSNDPNLIHFQ